MIREQYRNGGMFECNKHEPEHVFKSKRLKMMPPLLGGTWTESQM